MRRSVKIALVVVVLVATVMIVYVQNAPQGALMSSAPGGRPVENTNQASADTFSINHSNSLTIKPNDQGLGGEPPLPGNALAHHPWSLDTSNNYGWDEKSSSIAHDPLIKKVNQENSQRLMREAVKGFIANLAKANIAFNTPNTMDLQETQSISLLIDPRRTPSELKTELSKSLQGEFGSAASKQLITQESIKISDFVEARLTGAGFKIEASSRESQVIREDKPTEWTWDVTASEGGHHRLHLTIGTTVKIDGSDDYYELTNYDKYIDVEVAVTDRLVSFLDRYKDLIGYIVGPVSLLGLYQWWQGRKKKAIPTKKK